MLHKFNSMALGPKQMGEAVLRNLKSKTGKDAKAWIKLLVKKNLTTKKEICTFLKTEHGLGHFQAQKVYELFSDSDPYAASDTFEKLIFENNHTDQMYQKLKRSLLQFGADVRVQPCKTYIPFYRKKQFAIAKTKGSKLQVGVNLSSQPLGFEPAKELGSSERINYQTTLEQLSDIDEQLLAVLKESYSING